MRPLASIRALFLFLIVMGAAWSGVAKAGVIVAAGGGSEGDIGDSTAWSARLYTRLLQNGDRTGDGRITVAILSANVEDQFLPAYFVWLGASAAFNVYVPDRSTANNPAVVDTMRSADVVFLKGGDQGVYYDRWNDTRLEANMRSVVDTLGGAMGGTSAGAMSLGQYSFAGGKDLTSLDVLEDAKTPSLDDASDGGSGIHTDFFGFVPNAVFDTHYTTRARLGRLLGIHAKAVEDNGAPGLLAVGIDERTGVVITGSQAEVIGVGSVDFLQRTAGTHVRRVAGEPLVYFNLRLDRLTDGWRYDLAAHLPDTLAVPAGVVPVVYSGDTPPNAGGLAIHGGTTGDEERFQKRAQYAPFAYTLQNGTATPFVRGSVGIVDAQNGQWRGSIQETLFRALYDVPSYSGFLVAYSGALTRSASLADELSFQLNAQQRRDPEAAIIVVDGKSVSFEGLSPYDSNVDTGSGTLQAAALVCATVHVLADSPLGYGRYNTRAHAVVWNESLFTAVPEPPARVRGGRGREPGVRIQSAFPNPFGSELRLAYTLARTAHVRLLVLDARGRVVARLTDAVEGAGAHEATWPARSTGGARLPRGVYLVRLAAEGEVVTRVVVRM
jgi:cyanophycinase